jgi:hypothetical protein
VQSQVLLLLVTVASHIALPLCISLRCRLLLLLLLPIQGEVFLGLLHGLAVQRRQMTSLQGTPEGLAALCR